MARADRRRAQREARHARTRGSRRARGGSRTTSARVVEQTLFFTKLRRRAKWAFALMVIVFAVGFAFLGVGSGGLDLASLVQSVFGAGSGGTSVSKAQGQTKKHPNDPAAWKALADALQTKGRTDEEISALKRYVKLAPHDASQLQRLAQLEVQQADNAAQAYANVQANAQQLTAGSQFAPQFGSDAIQSALQSQVSTQQQTAQQAYTTASARAVRALQRLASVQRDTNSYTLLATTAEQFGKTAAALSAYEALLKLERDPGVKRQIEAKIKTLRASLPGSAG